MKKFFRLSAAFLLVGVLFVACIEPTPSAGIEEMRLAKAELIKAQAEVTKAHTQVLASQAAINTAEAARLQAEAARIQAQAKLVEAQAEYAKAETAYMREYWANQIAQLNAELEKQEAEVAYWVEYYTVEIAKLQAELETALLAYEKAMAEFKQWQIENATKMADQIAAELAILTARMDAVLYEIGRARVDLNVAVAAYEFYTSVQLKIDYETVILQIEHNRHILGEQMYHLENLHNEYEAILDEYLPQMHERIEKWIAQQTAFAELIAANSVEMMDLEEEWLYLSEQTAIAKAPLNELGWYVQIPAWEDNSSDFKVHVFQGVYSLGTNLYYVDAEPLSLLGLIAVMQEDKDIIDDTRAQFEGRGQKDTEAILTSLEAKKNQAEKAYIDNWNKWVSNYNDAEINGTLWTAWDQTYKAWNAETAVFRTNEAIYKAQYKAIDSLVHIYIDELWDFFDTETLLNLGARELSGVLGGITYDAGELLDWILTGSVSGGNAAVVKAIEYLLVLTTRSEHLNAIVTEIKQIFDGTHPTRFTGIPYFANATALPFVLGAAQPLKTAVMPHVYHIEESEDMSLPLITESKYHIWFLIYAMMEGNQLEMGVDGYEPFLTIGSGYLDAAKQIVEDFAGTVLPENYKLLYPTYNRKPQDAYYTAVENLTKLEKAMLEPYNRFWSVYDKNGAEYSNVPEPLAATGAYSIHGATTPHGYVFKYKYPEMPYGIWDPVYLEEGVLDFVAEWPSFFSYYGYDFDYDREDFFFVLEENLDATPAYPAPYSQMRETYRNGCDVWLKYAALLGVDNYCFTSDASSWGGDLPLWRWADRDLYGIGHFMASYAAQVEYDDFLTAYNHVFDGAYAALSEAIGEMIDDAIAKYNELYAAYAAAKAAEDEVLYQIQYLSDYNEYLNAWIGDYAWLIDVAGQSAYEEEGWYQATLEILHEALFNIDEQLATARAQYAALDVAMEQWEEGLGAYDLLNNPMLPMFSQNYELWYANFAHNFLANQSARFEAMIEALTVKIEGLLATLQVYEKTREALISGI